MGSTEREQAIEESITEPVKASGDTGSFEEHSISERIKADQYLAAKEARRSRSKGIQTISIIFPGAHG